MYTRNEFLKTDSMQKIRGQILGAAGACYGIAFFSALFNISIYKNYSSIIDSVFIFALGVLIHTLQSRVASVVLILYAFSNVILNLLLGGRVREVWLCFVGVYAVICTFKFHKAWKEYKNSPEAQMY